MIFDDGGNVNLPTLALRLFIFFHSALPSLACAVFPFHSLASFPSLSFLTLSLSLFPWVGVRTGIDLHAVHGALHRNTHRVARTCVLFLLALSSLSDFLSLTLSFSHSGNREKPRWVWARRKRDSNCV